MRRMHRTQPLAGKDAPLRRVRTLAALGLGVLALLNAQRASAQSERPTVGEGYIFAQAQENASAGGPAARLAQAQRRQGLSAQELLDPASRTWAGAAALHLALERPAAPLLQGVLAASGDGRAAAASQADGGIRIFGDFACRLATMPEGRPAYALALAPEAGLLAAWDQGAGRLLLFDLTTQACTAERVDAKLSGAVSLAVSPDGALLAAQDETGAVFLGERGGTLRHLGALPGPPAALGFSEAGGVLLAVDTPGRGAVWSVRDGRRLGGFEVKGGPFVRGLFRRGAALLWTQDGRLLRHDVLHRATEAGGGPEAPLAPGGWLELRDGALSFVPGAEAWLPAPVYDPERLALQRSERAGCLRLNDVDGLVRYYDARTGEESGQCFADDWSPVRIEADGSARTPELNLRVFDPAGLANATGEGPLEDSGVYGRMVSPAEALLWGKQASPPGASGAARAEGGEAVLRMTADTPQSSRIREGQRIALPLRTSLAAGAPLRRILLDLPNR